MSGTRGLLQNVIFAVSNAATKASGAARKAIVVWGLDRWDEPLGTGTFRRRVMWEEGGGDLIRGREGRRRGNASRRVSVDGGGGGLVAAVLRGAVGIFTEPIRGAEEGGVGGLVRGIQRGALGAVALPLSSLLEMCATTADSVRRAVAGSSNVGWLRPPRLVSSSEPLAPYDWSQAMGRWLLRELDRAETHGLEEFALCVPAERKDCYLVLTSRRVVYARARGLMWEPIVLWQTDISDLESVAVDPEKSACVRFVSHPPPMSLSGQSQRRGGGALSSSANSPLFSFLSVECADVEAAAKVREVAERSMEATPRRVKALGYGLVVTLTH